MRYTGRGEAAGDREKHLIEVRGANLALVSGCGVPIALGVELSLLQPDKGGHAVAEIVVRERECVIVDRVPAGEGDELKLVA